MSITQALRTAGKVLNDNSSVLLTSTAVAGTISTAIFAAKGAFEQGTEEAVHGVPEDPKERLKAHYQKYIPAVVMGSVTVGCVIGIHSVNTRKHAVLASAYSITDKAFKDYQEKVKELVGDKQELKVREAVAEKHISEDPLTGNEVFITGPGEQLCYDDLTGRYFMCDIETIRKAQNDINAQVLNEMYASQNDFYALIGLTQSAVGEELGWTVENLMDITFTAHLASDGRPALSLTYIPTPVRNYWKVGS